MSRLDLESKVKVKVTAGNNQNNQVNTVFVTIGHILIRFRVTRSKVKVTTGGAIAFDRRQPIE